MLFSEIYSVYYQVMARLIELSRENQLTNATLQSIINETAFEESFWFISNALRNEEWPLISNDFKTPLMHQPSMPLTNLQHAFLKSLFLDKRMQLFMTMPESLKDVEPLYDPLLFYTVDVFSHGDDYDDPLYKQHFTNILRAIKQKKAIKLQYQTSKGKTIEEVFYPDKIEYSAKDDRFRALCHNKYAVKVFNIARIQASTVIEDSFAQEHYVKRKTAWVELELKDYRNALERLLTSFANYKKETKKIDSQTYNIKLTYYSEDETELLIRILSFGPMVKVLGPEPIISQLKNRIHKQIKLCN